MVPKNFNTVMRLEEFSCWKAKVQLDTVSVGKKGQFWSDVKLKSLQFVSVIWKACFRLIVSLG
jgi:hypothetical protein